MKSWRHYLANLLAIILAVSGLQAIAISSAPIASALTWENLTYSSWHTKDWKQIRTNSDGSVLGIVSSGSLASNKGDFYISRDSGSTWTYTSADSGLGALAISGDGNTAIAAHDGKFYRATYSGSAWSNTSLTWGSPNYVCGTKNGRCSFIGPNWNALASSTDGTKWIAGPRDEVHAYTSTNSGVDWYGSAVGSVNYGTAISADGSIKMTANSDGKLYRNSGSGWSAITSGSLPSLPSSVGWWSVSCDSTCTKMAAVQQGDGKIFITLNAGASWNSYGSTLTYSDLSMSNDGSVIVATSGTEVYVSQDSGSNWTAQSLTGKSWVSVTVSGDGKKMYAAASDGTIKSGFSPTSTTTTLAVSNTSTMYGQIDTLTANINSSSATGTVDFKNNGTSITGCSAVTVTSGTAMCRFSSLAVGTYNGQITATYSGGGNYAASNSTALPSLTVTKAPLSVVPTATSVAYGGTPTYAKTYSGFTNGDSASSSSFTTGLTAPTCAAASYTTSTSVSASPLSITCSGGTSNNYTFTYESTANLTITQATPTVSIALSVATPTYGLVDTITATASLPGIVAFKIAGSAISGCENVSTALTSPYIAQCPWIPSAASTSFALTASFTPTNSIDYSTVTSSTTTTISSNRAAITVRPTAGQSKVYGANDPILSYTISSGSLIGSDALSGALTYTGAIVGSYAISIGTLTNTKYIITLASETFAITKATQSAVSLSSLSTAYNPSNKTVALTGTGGTGTGSYLTALDSSNTTPGCSVTGTTLTYTTAGTCVIAVTRSADTNFLARTDVVSFSIGLASQTITFNSLSAKNYSSDTFTVTATSSSSLTVVFTSGSPTICTTSGSNGSTITLLGVGTCVINANQAGDSNTSAASQVSQNFTVNPRAITITADAKTKIYGAIDPTLTYAITTGSLLLGDALTGTLTRATGTDAGTYQIQQGTLTTSNNPKYAITYTPANLSITRATPTLILTYPNSNVAILRPGAVDTPTVTTSSSSGSLTFATTTASSICTVDATSGVVSLFGAGSCAVVMSTAQTTNYIQYSETTTVTVALLSTSLTGIDQSKLVSMGQPFYAHASIDQSYSFSSGSNGASVAIPAGALDATVPISISLLTDATSQRALISSDGTSVLSVVVAWVASDGSVPSTNTGKAISVTLTNPSIKSGAKIYSVIGSQSQLLGISTTDGSVTTLITDDPVLLVINPVVTTPAPSSSGGGGYVMSVAVDNSAAILAANDKLAADKAAAELKAAQEKASVAAAEAAAIKAARDLADAQAQAAAELKASQDKAAAELRIAEELRLAKIKAEAELKTAAEKKAAADVAAAARAVKPAVTLYSVSPSLKLNTYDSAYLSKYAKSLKNGASVACIGYIYSKNTTVKKATALAKSQATAVCALMKKTNKTLKTSVVVYPATKAPKAATGAKWVGVSYRIDGFKAP